MGFTLWHQHVEQAILNPMTLYSFPTKETVTTSTSGVDPRGRPRRSRWFFLFGICFFALAIPVAKADVLGNAGFEEAIGNGTAKNWDGTNGVTRVTDASLDADPATDGVFSDIPEGQFAIEVNSTNGDFTFQTFDGVKEGDLVTFDGFAETTIAPGGGAQGGRLKIEFKKVNVDGTDVEISQVTSNLITTDNARAGDGFVQFTVQAVAPKDTQRVVFTLDILATAGGLVVWDNMNGAVNPGKLTIFASRNEVKVGQPVALRIRFRNATGQARNNVNLFIEVPPGFDAVNESIRVDGVPGSFREGSLIISLGTVGANVVVNTDFVVIPTAGVKTGRSYEIAIVANDGTTISERTRIILRVIGDPLFEEGTILGKVFHDTNKNGVQDQGELGIPGVKLVTEEGIIVVTDGNGQYHIPGIKEGRHLVKIDGHSLPRGTKFITEETYLVRTTAGILNKANFAVLLPPYQIPESFQEDLTVTITQGLDTTRPTLGVTMEPELLKRGIGVLEKDARFRFEINYLEFARTWYLEIRDALGNEVWTGYGVSAPPPEVVWQGETESGFLIKPGLYSYQLKVKDSAGRQDWTPLQFFRVISKSDPAWIQERAVEIPAVGDFNIFNDGRQSIPLVAKPTLRIQGQTKPKNSVTVNARPVPVSSKTGFFQTEIYVSPGEKKVTVQAISAAGEVTTYHETVTVKDSTFFMVALAEEQAGLNFQDGNIETVASEDTFKGGFYEDGRLSFYLRGKLKGKFLIQAHYDTDDTRSALFTNLDPDDYYPVYGDASQRNYESQDTLDRLYFVIEMDRSFVKWGSFHTNFTDTELATYNRTLSGLKLHFESLTTTPYGDPKAGITLFLNDSIQRADHNEFGATGGRRYSLRNRNVIEGSEKVRVEIRDKIQDMPIESRDLLEGVDYDIDYDEGRIMLSRPLSSVAASDTLVSNDSLDGNPVFLVVDYEFEVGLNVIGNKNRGARGYLHMGDHVKIGATVVEEKRGIQEYDLRAIDATFKFGRNTKLTAEFAETKLQQVNQAISFNGGLSFANLVLLQGPGQRERENAYLIKGETKPVEELEISGYVQGVEPGFSTDRIKSQEGFKKYGMNVLFRPQDYLRLRYRFDYNEVVGQLLPLEEHNVEATFNTQQSHTVQAQYDDGKWNIQAEYLRQVTDIPEVNRIPSLFSEIPFENGIALKTGYRLNDRLLPYVKLQTTIGGESNSQFGGGVRYEMKRGLFGYFEQMIGTVGDSALFGFEQLHERGGRSYANLKLLNERVGTRAMTTSVGSSFPISERSRVFSEREHSVYQGVDGFADILGYEGKLGDHWDTELTFERRHLDNSSTRLLDAEANRSLARTNTFNTYSGALAYADGDRIRARTYLEIRRDQDVPKLWQVTSQNSLEYQVNQDLSFLGKLDFGKSRFRDPGDTAEDFFEFHVGWAFRPVEHDRLNFLARYAYLRNVGNDAQFANAFFQGIATDETAHILAIDLAYAIHRYLGVVEKLALKHSILNTETTNEVILNTFLWINRFNFHVTRRWDLAGEYRMMWQSDAVEAFRQGVLVEADREFYDYVRLGLGYNFTDFDDDLRKTNSFDSHGPFVRLTGKF